MKKFLLLVCFCFAGAAIGQECLNVDYKIRGYFYAGTSMIDTISPGGYYTAPNSPKIIPRFIRHYGVPKAFQIVVKTDETAPFTEKIAGFKVYVMNKSYEVVDLSAQDSRINMVRQVFYEGTWKDVEYLPSSWCGNSYHTVYSKPDSYWEFIAPCFEGDIEATFRFKLDVDGENTIYSNEFAGSFNIAQLTEEQGYTPQNIMDPYRN